jgi:hypothetical protein
MKSYFSKHWDKISIFVDRIKNFAGMVVDILEKYFKCLEDGIKSIGSIIDNFVNKIVVKIAVIKLALLTPIGIPLIIADIVTGLLCNWKEFHHGINLIIDGVKQNNKRAKYFRYGQGTAQILKTLVNSQSYFNSDWDFKMLNTQIQHKRILKIK